MRPQRPSMQGRALSNGSYRVRRPNLAQVLADKAPAPWSLANFRAYCHQNMCLENLEFTIDAKQYQALYEQVYTAQSDGASAADARQLTMLWKNIIKSYITRNGIQEINLPAVIRDNLLLVPDSHMPPPPEVLSPALDQIHILMEDSILPTFLSESQSSHRMDLDFVDERALKTRSMFVESSAIPIFPPPFAQPGCSSDLDLTDNLSLADFQRAIRPKDHLITKYSHSSSAATSTSGDPGLTDDNISFTTRDTADTNEATSPPRTPPTSAPQSARTSTSYSKAKSRSNSGSSNGHHSSSASESLKKMGNKLGFRSHGKKAKRDNLHP